ncbi:MAG: hypothetical protein GW938_12900 [Leptospira sp.]|nr:hypothetical protein [Leptospira sp.]NCS92416.1 hypothetical protein [Leptospira sp.]
MEQTNKNNSIETTVSTNPWLNLLEDIFFRPHYAFESFLNREDMGSREIWKLHIFLSTLAPISKIFSNFAKAIYHFFLHRSAFSLSDITSGSLQIWIFFLVAISAIRFADIFRVYYKRWDRTANWNPPVPWVLMIGFIPFTASGIFFFLPTPFNIGIMLLSFVYSLNLSYQALQNISNWTSEDFLSYLLQVAIFFSIIGLLFTFTYNIYRTIFQ